jgi:hypothetical protein
MYRQIGNTIVRLSDISCLARKSNVLYIILTNGNTVKEEFVTLLDAIKEFNKLGETLLNLGGKQDDTVET